MFDFKFSLLPTFICPLLFVHEKVENLNSQFKVPLREKAAFFNCLGPYLFYFC